MLHARFLPGLILAAAGSLTLHAADGKGPVDLLFADLRVQPGYVEGGYGTKFGITFGDVGGFNRGYVDTGYVFSVRGLSAGKVDAVVDGDKDTKQEFYQLGLQLAGGIAVSVNAREHVEIQGGYGTGMHSMSGKVVDVGNDGRFEQWLVEGGWYHTFRNQVQLGLVGGITWSTFSFSDAGGDHTARARGLDLAASFGYRL